MPEKQASTRPYVPQPTGPGVAWWRLPTGLANPSMPSSLILSLILPRHIDLLAKLTLLGAFAVAVLSV